MIQKRKRKELYDKFRQGAIPSGADFADFIRSQLNLLDDGIDVSDDPDDPLCIRSHGDEEGYLAFADPEGRKKWQISGLDESGTREGLHFTADKRSRLYIDRETGNLGIHTDDPQAKLHLKQTGATDAFRVDDEGTDSTPFIITSEGKVGIGVGQGDERPSAMLHINSPGVGDAFRVDDASQDVSPFLINSEGNVGVGTPSPAAKLTILGGVSIGQNSDPGENNLFVKGNLEIEGSIIVTGGPGTGGIEVDGSIRATSKDFVIEDNLHVVSDPDQEGADGNLSVEGDTTLGTFNLVPEEQNVVTVNGKIKAGYNPETSEKQLALEINEVFTVNRDENAPGAELAGDLSVLGSGILGNNTGNNRIYLNGTVQRQGPNSVTIDDNLTVTRTADIFNAVIRTITLRTGTTVSEISTDTRLYGESNDAIPTERAVKQYIDNLLAGSVAPFAMTIPPEGWLECNGQSISRTTYSRLYSLIGTRYGAGNGSTTFNVPDLRDEFIRGWNRSGGRSLGGKQGDAFENHIHNFYGNYNSVYNSGHDHADRNGTWRWTLVKRAHEFYKDKWVNQYEAGGRTSWDSHSHNYTPYGTISNPSSGSHTSETRPQNIVLLYCIKF